ncbi:MAG: FAD-binding oxidoreductase [Ferruginibacter sp.]|nr:FAD-binding oxidoreductase [Chitinophagaceae bacterium]
MNLKAGYPYSLIKNGLVGNYPKLGKNIRTDVVIMGGGISGALTAWHLVKNNIPCIVLDARTIGLGSTCASTSLLQYETDVPLFKLAPMIGLKNAARSYWLCKEAIAKLGSIANKIGFKNFQEKESLYYAAAKKDVGDLKKEFLIRKKQGFRVRYLEEDIFKKTGLTAPAAILSADAAQTDAYMFTHHLHQDGLKKGLRVFDRTPVVAIDHKTRGVELVTENGYRVKAKKLVYATGYEVVEYIDKPIVKLKSTYATISEPLPEQGPYWKNDRLLWNTADPYLYMRTTPDNRIVVGGRDENFYSPKKRDQLIVSKTKQLTGDFKKLFPGIDFIPEFTWTGVFGSTKDGLPFIGPYKKLPNSYFALGFGGNGIVFSLIAAEMIASQLIGKKNPDAPIFSFDRL